MHSRVPLNFSICSILYLISAIHDVHIVKTRVPGGAAMLDTNYFNSKQSYEASSLSQTGQLSPPPDRHNKFPDGRSTGKEIIVLSPRKPLHCSATCGPGWDKSAANTQASFRN